MASSERIQRLVISSSQYDAGMAFSGSTPGGGDSTGVGVTLPATPTTAPNGRYLVRLCGVDIGKRSRAVVRSFRQLLTIGAHCAIGMDENGDDIPPYLPVECDVVSPAWHFVDGNVSWHMRKVQKRDPAKGRRVFTDAPPQYMPFSYSDRGNQSSILARNTAAAVNWPLVPGYIPLNNGMPYGTDVSGMGTFRDMRFPYAAQMPQRDLGLEVQGPCNLVMFASVYQTDPTRRPVALDKQPPLESLRPEDKFILQYPDARYWRIGAELVVDLYNDGD